MIFEHHLFEYTTSGYKLKIIPMDYGMTSFFKMILKLAFLFLVFLTQALVSFGQTRSTVLYDTTNGLIAAPRSFFFTNILAGTNLVIYTNGNGTITIAGTVVGGGGSSLVTNGNQFGPSTTLTIKDGALLTNLVVYGTTTNALRIASGVITSSLPAIDISQTWSNSGVTFTGLRFQINDTNSASGSSFGLFNYNSASQFSFVKGGDLRVAGAQSGIQAWNSTIGSGNRVFFLSANTGAATFRMANNSVISWASTGEANDADLSLYRDAAATLQLGADAATATAQTIKAHDGSGSDKDGASLTITSGKMTGGGVGGNLYLSTTLPSGGGATVLGTQVERVIIPANPANLTAGSPNNIFQFYPEANSFAGVEVFATIYATDGSDQSIVTDSFNFSIFEAGGTISSGISGFTSSTVSSTTVMTTAYALTDVGGSIILYLTPSITPGWTVKCSYQIRVNTSKPFTYYIP